MDERTRYTLNEWLSDEWTKRHQTSFHPLQLSQLLFYLQIHSLDIQLQINIFPFFMFVLGPCLQPEFKHYLDRASFFLWFCSSPFFCLSELFALCVEVNLHVAVSRCCTSNLTCKLLSHPKWKIVKVSCSMLHNTKEQPKLNNYNLKYI